MKKIFTIISLSVFFIAAFTSGDAFAGRAIHRQIHQHQRIIQGTESGELTKGETAGLLKEQRAIHHLKKNFWKDGALTPMEKCRLENAQDRSSHHIYRLKHNGRNR